MATSYDLIKDKFFKRLRGDKRFFAYKNLTETEIIQLANDHFEDLLEQSVEEIYKYDITPQIDFYNRDNALKQFNDDLNIREISLLVDLCYLKYFNEDKNKLHEFSLVFKSNELNTLSPANERNSVLEMINDMEDKVASDIIKYLSTDRNTGKTKTSQIQIELR